MDAIPALALPASPWLNNVGITGGIPTGQTIWGDVGVMLPGYTGALAVGDGVADDTDALNYAINNCPYGQVVQLGSGAVYKSRTLQRGGANYYDNVQRHFSFILRGDKNNPAMINMQGGHGIYLYASGDFTARGMTIVSGNARGSTSVIVDHFDEYLVVGMTMMLQRINSESGAVNGGTEVGDGYMHNCCSQLVKVTALNPTTKQIDFFPKANEAFASDSVRINISAPTRCGFENFKINNRNGDDGVHNIFIDNGNECWIKNVESDYATKWHFRIGSGFRCEIRDCFVHDGKYGYGDSIYGAGLYQYCCNCLVENNRFLRTRHALITEYGGQGNVFGYNYSKDPINNQQLETDYVMGDLTTHGGEPRYNLWEGNVGATLRWDAVLGGGSKNFAFRNWIQRMGLNGVTYIAAYGTDIQRWNGGSFVIGNVYNPPPAGFTGGLRRWGTDGDTETLDDTVEPTTYLNGEYTIEDGMTQWATADHTLVNSLYLPGKPSWWETDHQFPGNGTDMAVKADGNPASRGYLDGDTPATAVSMSGPSTGLVNVDSSNFTVSLNGSTGGTVVVTPVVVGAGGTFTPTTISLTNGARSGTFKFTPTSTGTSTISATNNGSLTNPSSLSYNATNGGGGGGGDGTLTANVKRQFLFSRQPRQFLRQR